MSSNSREQGHLTCLSRRPLSCVAWLACASGYSRPQKSCSIPEPTPCRWNPRPNWRRRPLECRPVFPRAHGVVPRTCCGSVEPTPRRGAVRCGRRGRGWKSFSCSCSSNYRRTSSWQARSPRGRWVAPVTAQDVAQGVAASLRSHARAIIQAADRIEGTPHAVDDVSTRNAVMPRTSDQPANSTRRNPNML
jgi:hypothetical protein